MPTNFTIEQLYFLVHAASQLDRFFALQLFFVVFTGCTVDESCDLTWEDLFIDEREARVGGCKYSLNDDAMELLSLCSREFDPYIFSFRNPGQIHSRTKILAGRIGERFTVSDLRRNYAAVSWWNERLEREHGNDEPKD